MSCHLLTES